MINDYLRGQSHIDDHSIHLLFSANRWELVKAIEADITNGITVIVDRYSYSGVVYTVAKANPDLSLDWAWHPEIGLPRPDLCLFLRISPEEAAKRGGFGAERYENEPMQRRVRALFQDLFDRQQGEDEAGVRIVDAGRAFEEVSRVIGTAVDEAMARVGRDVPLRRLGPIQV